MWFWNLQKEVIGWGRVVERNREREVKNRKTEVCDGIGWPSSDFDGVNEEREREREEVGWGVLIPLLIVGFNGVKREGGC